MDPRGGNYNQMPHMYQDTPPNFQGQGMPHGMPLGMGPPGGMPPPGMSMQGPPGMYPGGSPANFQGFQAPPLVPGIDMTASVIRMGGAQPSGRSNYPDNQGGRRGAGLGFDGRERRDVQMREPTDEEIKRTLMVMDITPGCRTDALLESILGVGGGLRSFIRVTDEDYKPTTMGFAEYEDVDSFHRAVEILQDVYVPKEAPKETKAEALARKEGEEELDPASDESKSELKIIVDPNSLLYIESWRSRGSMEDPEKAQFRIDSAKEDLSRILHHMCYVQEGQGNGEYNEDTADNNAALRVAAANVPATTEDELSDIPEAMRETVAKEIANFRNRSVLRELERAKREEELEAAEKRRGTVNRLATPPPNVPSGPSAANGARVPTGPRGNFQGAQLPQDYRNGVAFVGEQDSLAKVTWNDEDDDTDASDWELERRRSAKEDAEEERKYQAELRRWETQEGRRAGALERDLKRDQEADAQKEALKENMGRRLREWNDDTESARGTEEYYADRAGWTRKRAVFRAREKADDDRDREEEAREHRTRDRDVDMADQFLEQQAQELESRHVKKEPAKFTMSLGAAANRVMAASAPRRTFADVEGLLEDDEEEDTQTTKRTLRPLADMPALKGPEMTREEHQAASRELAREIPTDRDALFEWPMKWELIDPKNIHENIRALVEKKIMDYLGMQEDMLVEVIVKSLLSRTKPEDLVKELEGALDEEAEALVKKIWRMLIFFSESVRRGLTQPAEGT